MKKHRLLAPRHQRSFAVRSFILLLVFTLTSSSPVLCLTPMEELEQLAQLPAAELRKPENQEKIAQATMQIFVQQSSDGRRKAAAKAHAEAPKIAAELNEVAKEMRAKLLPSKQKD